MQLGFDPDITNRWGRVSACEPRGTTGLMAELAYRIWIAEDNPADVYLIEEALRREGFPYRLQIADNGEDMMNKIAALDQNPNEKPPDLFMIDLNLPRRSGADILAGIRRSSSCAHVPVIIITSSDSPEDRSRTRELGASYYFRKPPELDRFLSIGGIVGRLLTTPVDPAPLPS